jgi:hypothetical protein
MEEIQRDLLRLIHYASGLRQLMTELQQAAPERGEGSDATGMVRAELGAGGFPTRIAVRSQWEGRLRARLFGAAVAQACEAAQQRRGLGWSRALEQAAWQERMGRLDTESLQAAAAAREAVPPAFRRPGPGAVQRSFMSLYEEVMSAADAAMAPASRAQPSSSPGVGRNPERTVTISVTRAGRLTCQADPRWVSGRDGSQLTQVAALVFGIQGVTNSFKQLLEPADTLPGDEWPLATT